jgi:hypothetical protein
LWQSALFRTRSLKIFLSPLRLLFVSFAILEDHTTRASSEGDSTRNFDMYSSSNTLNRRPRGFSGQALPAVKEESSILPQFLRRLSSHTSSAESHDRAEKAMIGNNLLHANGCTHRHPGLFVSFRTAFRGRMFKILGILICLLTISYFFLPWAPSISPFGISRCKLNS